MRRETEIEDADYGFTWCAVEGTYFLRTVDGNFRQVNRAVIDLLRTLAKGELTVAQLEAQVNGGEPVIADESETTAEEVLEFIEGYLEQGVLRRGEPVVRLIPPADIKLWPRVLLFLVPLSIVVSTLANHTPQLHQLVFDPPGFLTVAAVVLCSFFFAGIHESGHYVTSTRHFESSIRVDLVNGIVPAVITDTTGAWMLPRNRRIWINLAGPLVELTSVSFVIGLLGGQLESQFQLLLVVMVFSHTVFALNPLIHGDGYWIMCDLLNIVNVRPDGIEDVKTRQFSWRAVYVVASYAFGVFMIINSVALTMYSRGLRGVVYLLPLLFLFVLSQTEYRLQPDLIKRSSQSS